jgi:hypothetical protein
VVDGVRVEEGAMPCIRRKRDGHCSHYQCPYVEATGLDCVDVVGDWCEAGEGCILECDYSWPADDTATTEKADRAFEQYFTNEWAV